MTQKISLDVIDIPEPCPVKWEDMRGDDRVRHCGQCQLNVYHLSDMTRGEAEALIASHEGRLCVQFYRRADGRILTRRCPKALSKAAKWAWGRIAAAVALLLGLAYGALAMHRDPNSADPALASMRSGMDTIKEHEPVRSIMNWLSPTPSPRIAIGGAICITPRVVPPPSTTAPAPLPAPSPAE
ncbi:MAG: hypothetical protein GC162_14670 [Planctomycetes bacterium]|nr:hypothetical protein [Planctomycetota bacterium]